MLFKGACVYRDEILRSQLSFPHTALNLAQTAGFSEDFYIDPDIFEAHPKAY